MPHGALKDGAHSFECVPHAQVCCSMTRAHKHVILIHHSKSLGIIGPNFM